MTDKEQIIIDGKGCKYKTWDAECSLTGDHYGDNMKPCKFIDEKSCYFKQLARKTQELETICKAFDIEYGYDEGTGVIVGRCNKLIEKENELEEYKQSLNEKNKFLQDLGISAGGEFKRIKFYIENLKNKYNEKVEECEELISEKDFYLQKIAVLEHECEELKEKLRELELKNTTLQNRNQQLDGSMTESDRYRKALEEIKDIIATSLSDDHDPAEGLYGEMVQILDIINKAKGEGNE